MSTPSKYLRHVVTRIRDTFVDRVRETCVTRNSPAYAGRDYRVSGALQLASTVYWKHKHRYTKRNLAVFAADPRPSDSKTIGWQSANPVDGLTRMRTASRRSSGTQSEIVSYQLAQIPFGDERLHNRRMLLDPILLLSFAADLRSVRDRRALGSVDGSPPEW